MSLEEARRLIESMNTDEELREKVLAAPDVAARLELARAEGYDVTEDEIHGASAALNDVDLGMVSAGELECSCLGGLWSPSPPCWCKGVQACATW